MSVRDRERIEEIRHEMHQVIKFFEFSIKERDKILEEAAEVLLRHQEEIKDLQETISELVLLTGETDSINIQQTNGGINANSTE